MVQRIIVILILVACAAYIAVKIYGMVVRRNNPCSGCPGCDIRKEFEQHRKNCGGPGKSNCH